MNSQEKKIVVGGVVIAALSSAGFSMAQGDFNHIDDDYQSPTIISEKTLASNESTSINTPKTDVAIVDENNEEEEIEIMKAAYCRHCRKNYGMPEINSIKLQSNLLLPTYLKNLSNIQIKLVWQNAAIELSEATRIVFIGYSLPAADFEIRQLLARMIRPDAEIQVVLYPYNPRVEAEAERYRNFFGSRISEGDIMRLTVPEYVGKLKEI